MKTSTKLICLLLAAAMLLSLCACGGSTASSEVPETESAPESFSAVESVSDEAAPAEEDAETVSSYPVAPEGTRFSFWSPESGPFGTYINSWNENVVFSKMAELTNIDFDFKSTPNDASVESFSLMVASGDYTDLIFGFADYYPEGMDNAIDDDVILDLSDLAAEFAPEYYNAIMNEEKAVVNLALSDSGRLWGIHRVYEKQQIGIGFMMRKDLLDGLGLEVPATYAQMEDALMAITEEYIPTGAVLLGSGGFLDLFGGSYDFSAGYEIGTLDNPFINKDGTAVYTPATQGWHDYLEMMARWYEKGILNQDFPSMAGPDYFSKISAGELAAVDFFFDQCSNFANTATDPNCDMIGVAYPSVNEGDQLHLLCADPRLTTNMSVVISTHCTDPGLLLQYFNYFWTDEGRILANYGIEDEHYNLDADGHPVLTDSRKQDISILDDVYTYRSGPILVLQDYFDQTLDKKSYDCLNVWTASNDGAYVLPRISFDSDEAYELSGIQGDLATYVSEYTLKIICGQEDLDATWDDYLENLSSLNYEKMQEIYQAALDRFLDK